MSEVKLTGLKDVVAWLECQPQWSGVAVRRVDDPPIPGEPFISMKSAKHLVVSAVSIMDNRSFEAAARIEALVDLGPELERIKDDKWPTVMSESVKTILAAIEALTAASELVRQQQTTEIEITDDMMQAGMAALHDYHKNYGDDLRAAFKAMLSAAPASPTGEDVVEKGGCKMAWKQGFCYGDPEYYPPSPPQTA